MEIQTRGKIGMAVITLLYMYYMIWVLLTVRVYSLVCLSV